METFKKYVLERGISRLCHFMPGKNFAHMITGGKGIVATAGLEKEELDHTPTDIQRLDGHKSHISCSIEYPNCWFLDQARKRDPHFKDWVILFIDKKYLFLPETRFCPRNASANYGKDIRGGTKAFLSLYEDQVVGQGGHIRKRTDKHLSCSPTDDQAEVLVYDCIEKKDILGVAVQNEKQAKTELSRLRLLGINKIAFPIIIVPEIFDKNTLAKLIRLGQKPQEVLWKIK